MKCVSLFSGCGGLDLGLQRAGFEIVAANDMDSRCAQSHEVNFPSTKFLSGSVAALTQGVLLKKLSERGIGEVDILAGGPPCQPFSKSRFYRKEKLRGIQDPTGHETINGYLDLIDELRPRAFLMENVHGFAYKVHEAAFHRLRDTADRLGYSLSWAVLDAADFGVPQHRKRFFAVGMRDGSSFDFPRPTHGVESGGGQARNGIEPYVTAGDVLNDLESASISEIPGHFAGGQHHDLLRGVPPGDNYLFYTEKRGHPNPKFVWRSRYWSFLLKLSPDRPSWTIQARRSNNMGPFHWNSRILTIDEVKRLQTFPDDWFLAGNVEQQWRQVGNAVPPRLAENLASAIFRALSKSEGSLESHGKRTETAVCE